MGIGARHTTTAGSGEDEHALPNVILATAPSPTQVAEGTIGSLPLNGSDGAVQVTMPAMSSSSTFSSGEVCVALAEARAGTAVVAALKPASSSLVDDLLG
eukprot:GHVU01202531.1.p1 GENE.GHVU01202531.1~~GHVU01202531.1.p1  ORF type:complete len:100 (-),score=14.61 GHVU01202531.1:554-853(-)